MSEYRYLIVGGGMTADAACRGIREHDADGTIGLVTAENHPPYSRPPLSKGLWQDSEEASIWRGTEDLGVELHLGRRIVSIDVETTRALDDHGDEYAFERVLLATGGRPRRLPGEADSAGVVYYRTLDDYRRVRNLADRGASFVVIGGGFIGSEIAACLVGAGCEVTMVFPEPGIGGRLFPAGLAEYVNEQYRSHGIEVIPEATVERVERSSDGVTVTLADERVLEAGGVVAGLGIVPADELAVATGIGVDDGIVVDHLGRAGGSGIVFAAGDVARYPDPWLRKSVRVEHEHHANSHGQLVGANMAGAGLSYPGLPFFYSDLFDLGYEAVGQVDSRLELVEEWAEPNRRGVVAYLDERGRPRGILLWDVWGKVDDARELIRANAPLDPAALRAFL